MADKAKKKGGKLPIILVAVLVVAGGGFFAMSGNKKEEPEEEPEVELGGVESLGDEFVVNLRDGTTYLVTNISVHVAKDAHAYDPAAAAGGKDSGKKENTYSVARDAVNTVLASKSIDDLTKENALKYLRREIAAAINHSLRSVSSEEKDSKRERRRKDKEEEGAHEIDHEWLDEIGMDSEEGPVLRVYFDKFMYTRTR